MLHHISHSNPNIHACYKPGNGGRSVEHDQLFKPGEGHNEFVYQIWAKSYQPLVWKCTANAQLVRGYGNSLAHYQKFIRFGEAHD